MTGMQPNDLALIATAGDISLSPDGTQVAYTLTTTDLEDNRYRRRIWLAETDRSGSGRPLSAGPGDGHARFSPDGTMVAWISHAESGASAIEVMRTSGVGEPNQVCEMNDEITDLVWSPDSARLAFIARVRDVERYGTAPEPQAAKDMPPRRVTTLRARLNGEDWIFDRQTQLHVVPADGSSKPVCLTSARAGVDSVSWSPSGDRLAYAATDHDNWDLDLCNDLWLIDAAGGAPRRLTASNHGWLQPVWSPDGSSIAAMQMATPGSGPCHPFLWVLDPETGQASRWAADVDLCLAPYYGAGSPPIWEGNDAILTAVDDHGSTRLYRLSASAGEPIQVGGQQLKSWGLAGDRLAWSTSDPTTPGEVWTAPLSDPDQAVRLTDHGRTLRERVDLVAPVSFTARSADGTEVECWAMAPAGASSQARVPTILNIHGGPYAQYGWTFFDEFQFQTAAGYGVIFCNPRGSSGREEAWARAVRWPEAEVDPGSGWGGVDYQDVMACAEAAVEQLAWVDPERLGVQGGSYGGYMTSWIVGHTDRFKAAISERAVNNLVTMESDSDIAGFFREYVGYNHLERPELYVRQSPMTYAKDITTPLLMIHSEQDLRCPISQAEELFVTLRLLGRDPELVRFPGENHELSRSGSPKHRVMRAEIILEWFDRYLKG